MGNLHSVARKLSLLGVKAQISSDPNAIENADKIILPGVGHFGKAMAQLNSLGLVESLNKAVLIEKKPILGICLGMQLMAKHSHEGDSQGLGWFDADVVRFDVNDKFLFKVPHTGWNQASIEKQSPLFKDIPNQSEFYFVHAYHFKCNNQTDVLNTTDYSYKFVSAIQKDNIYGVQYHPEKSHEVGLQMFKNFVNL